MIFWLLSQLRLALTENNKGQAALIIVLMLFFLGVILLGGCGVLAAACRGG